MLNVRESVRILREPIPHDIGKVLQLYEQRAPSRSPCEWEPREAHTHTECTTEICNRSELTRRIEMNKARLISSDFQTCDADSGASRARSREGVKWIATHQALKDLDRISTWSFDGVN